MAAIILPFPYETGFHPHYRGPRMPTTRACVRKASLQPEEAGLSCPVRVEVFLKKQITTDDIVGPTPGAPAL